MNGYGETLRQLADSFGVPFQEIPPAKTPKLHRYLAERIRRVNDALPTDGLPRDQELLRALVFGLLAQDTGWSDRPDVHVAKGVEQRLVDLERRGRCDTQASMLQCITVTNRQWVADLTPHELAELFGQLAEEVKHAESTHLHNVEPHLNHCPSLQPEVRAVKHLKVVLPIAVQLLVGDSKDCPRHVADRILTGETS